VNWIAAHPALFVAVLWPIVSAIITTVFRKRTVAELAELPPRVASFLKFTMAFGIDVPRTLDAIYGIVKARVPGIETVPTTTQVWANAVAIDVDLMPTTRPSPQDEDTKP